ncbi:MAG TPA: NAD(P)H-quinone oxidoreductase [Mycobacteriales bacterium]|nr:NAD(P)H-quinone oxidoreductase [Mycobacteriales bacterium]
MRAVTMSGFGDVDVLQWGAAPDVVAGAGEVLVEVVASAVNRADLLQRQGFYPPPAGASEILGLECSGRIAAVGAGVERWAVGDDVCALLAGGGYAEQVAVPAGQCMSVPAGVDLVTAAGLPEVACTVWSNLVGAARLRAGESVLVHGGTSGIGSLALQVAKALGAGPVIATAGSAAKLERCGELGADAAVDYHAEDFVAAALRATDGRGVDVVLDIVGAAYLARNVEVLANDGRLVVIGLQGGTRAEIDLNALLRKRGSLLATSLRARPLDQKAAICRAVEDGLWPLIAAGRVQPVVAAAYPMNRVADAHRLVASSAHTGKVLLTVPTR